MKKKLLISTFVLLALILAACQAGNPLADDATETAAPAAATAQPTDIPTQNPTRTDAPTTDVQCRNTDWFDTKVNPSNSTDIDVELVGTESCTATWRAANTNTATAVCPEGWVCTFDVVNDIVLIYEGTGQEVQIHAATWRPKADFCHVLQGEQDFAASQTPTFQVDTAPNSPSCP